MTTPPAAPPSPSNRTTSYIKSQRLPVIRCVWVLLDEVIHARPSIVDERPRHPLQVLLPYVLVSADGYIEQLPDIVDVDVLLLPHVRTGRRAVVGPALELEQEERDERHDGQLADPLDAPAWYVGDVQAFGYEHVHLDAAWVAAAARAERAPEDAVVRVRVPRVDKEEGIVRVDEDLFELLLVVIVREDDEVDILAGADVIVFIWLLSR